MWEVLKFEVRYRLKRPATYIYFGILFLMAFLAVTTDVVQIGGGVGQVKQNSPWVIANMMLILSAFGMLTVSAVMGVPVLRDYEHHTSSIFFTTPITKAQYLFGRFLGSFILVIFIFTGMFWGFALGHLMPWLDAERLVSYNIGYYVSPFVNLILPNIFFLSCIFFAGGALSKKMITVYSQGALLLVIYLISFRFINDIENKTIAGLADPFAINTFRYYTQYWTIAEKNALTVSLDGAILLNRLGWIAIGLISLGLTYFGFSFSSSAKGKRRRKAKEEHQLAIETATASVPQVTQYSGPGTVISQTLGLSLFYFKWIVKQVPFLAIVIAGIGLFIVNSMNFNRLYGTYTYFSTYTAVELIGTFSLFFLIIIVFYTGELIWKERDVKINLIYDAMPFPNFVTVAGKFLGLVYVYVALLLFLIAAGVLVQVGHGYYKIDFSVYFTSLFTETFFFLLLYTLLGFFIHVMVNHKFVGHALFVTFFILQSVMSELGVEHSMFYFGSGQLGTFSEMNRFGHYFQPFSWFQTYWFALSLVFFVIAVLLSVRGTEAALKWRLKIGQSQLSRPVLLFLFGFFAVFLFSGGYIYYNTNVVNTYRNSKQIEANQAEYEKQLKKYEFLNQPKMVDVFVEVDVFPETRDFVASGYYILKNKSDEPIGEVHIQHNPDFQVQSAVQFTRGVALKEKFDKFRYEIFELPEPLAPGDTMKMNFQTTFTTKGFVEGNTNTNVVYNGTFFNNSYFPSIGYNPGAELGDDDTRKEQGLPEKERMMERNNPRGLSQSLFGDDADKIDFEIIMSTSPEQIAIAPGYLEKEWLEAGRRYFHYKMDAPMVPFYSMVSAEYEVATDTWQSDSGDIVNLEIYYHKGHEYNLERMMKGMKESLTYYSRNFSPYQYRQLRIMEFPRYQSFAQSFANTVPFSEGIGFVQKIEEDDIDMPFYVTAHEVAHQWWGHQVTQANVKGSAMVSETLSQYSALMVMKKNYPIEQIQEFLEYELDRYLSGRTTERKKENPIVLVEGQGYIHYRKGSLLMYALQDFIGEDSVNAALKRFRNQWVNAEGHYPTTKDLMKEIDAVTPDSLDYILEDMFETITLYENRAKKASYEQVNENEYHLTLDLESIKYRADSLGNENKIELNDWIDIGVYYENEEGEEKLAYLEKHKIDGQEKSITVTVDKKPVRAGIDPLNKLIDRNPEDNRVNATESEEEL